MKKAFYSLILLLFSIALFGQGDFSLVSWNIRDFGQTKNADEIAIIAKIVRDYDIVAIQEVVAGYGGAQAVARLADELNRLGSKWDYVISDPTQSPPYKTERYAFLWKTSKIKLKNAWLDEKLSRKIDREPFLAKFQLKGKSFIIANYHSKPHKDHPEEEIKLFYDYPSRFSYPLIIAGDFNTNSTDAVFNPLYDNGFTSNLINEKTTLKRQCNAQNIYKNHAIDFILYQKKFFHNKASGIIDFVHSCYYLTEARLISDHLPVFLINKR